MNTIIEITKCSITIPKNWQYQTDGFRKVIINPQSSKAYIRIDTNLGGKFKNSRIIEGVDNSMLEISETPDDKGIQIDISKLKDGKDILLVRRYNRSDDSTLNVNISEQEKLTASRKVPKRKVRGAEKSSEQPPAQELTRVPRPYSYDL